MRPAQRSPGFARSRDWPASLDRWVPATGSEERDASAKRPCDGAPRLLKCLGGLKTWCIVHPSTRSTGRSAMTGRSLAAIHRKTSWWHHRLAMATFRKFWTRPGLSGIGVDVEAPVCLMRCVHTGKPPNLWTHPVGWAARKACGVPRSQRNQDATTARTPARDSSGG